MVQPQTVAIIESTQIAPPPNTVSTTSMPLTFFDIPWLICCPMQRLFFYEYPHPISHFIDDTLPNLKRSLSLTLRYYFTFAGKLISPNPPDKPYLLFVDGVDSIPLNVVESTGIDFYEVIGDRGRDVKMLHPFVPELTPRHASADGTLEVPLLSLQVTIFPNVGICIGVEFCHVLGDGIAFNHFMKSWACVCRSNGGDLCSLDQSLVPCYDRSTIKDPLGLESVLIKDWWQWGSNWDYDLGSPIDDILANKARATVKIGASQVKLLKDSISFHFNNTSTNKLRASTFVVTCAVVWVTLVKTQEITRPDKDKTLVFVYVADCRQRLEPKLPTSYIGNCLSIRYVTGIKKSELIGPNGVFIAAKAIGEDIMELESENGIYKGGERWLSNWKEVTEDGVLTVVAGSPRLRVYETDFGWGKPKKSEVVHIDVSESGISISECGDEEGGVEIGIVVKRDQMEVFNGVFEEQLTQKPIK